VRLVVAVNAVGSKEAENEKASEKFVSHEQIFDLKRAWQ
jgi:hypothetical protein